MSSFAAPTVVLADQRVTDILLAARQAFAEKGFDGASMQDLARTAGMSVGNFYRYFPSKAAIVDALIGRDLDEMEQDFATILTASAPMEALRHKIRERVVLHGCAGDGQLWAEITAASLRKPEIGATTARMEAEIVAHLATIFARVTGCSREVAMARHGVRAALIVMMVKACTMRPPEPAALHVHLTEMVLRIIDTTLDEVVQDVTPGKIA